MNDTTQKIAVEAARRIVLTLTDENLLQDQEEWINTVAHEIQSAIEKATVELRQENLRLSAYCIELDKAERASRAAHASEPWTVEKLQSLYEHLSLYNFFERLLPVLNSHARERKFERGERPCVKPETDGISISHGGATSAQNALDRAHSEGVAVGLASANKPAHVSGQQGSESARRELEKRLKPHDKT